MRPTKRDIAQHILANMPEGRNIPEWIKKTSERKDRAKPRKLEEQLQIAICDYLETQKLLYWSTPNHLFRGRQSNEGAFMGYMAQQKRMGLKRGVPDLCVLKNGKLLMMELKAPGGKATPEQQDFMIRAVGAGAICAVVNNLDAAIALVKTLDAFKSPAEISK